MNGNGEAPITVSGSANVIDVLERFRRPRPRPGERCEMCGEDIGDEHSHVVNLNSRSLLCTCRPCYLLFAPTGAGSGRYRAVPDRYFELPGLLTPGQWESLQIPVGVAFFFANSSLDEVVAFYPGPGGATESLLSLDVWKEIVDAEPALAGIEPDVEALLVRAGRAGGDGDSSRPECFLVPIDACYELVGTLRRLWKGFDGGQEAHEALDRFFAGVRERSRPVPA